MNPEIKLTESREKSQDHTVITFDYGWTVHYKVKNSDLESSLEAIRSEASRKFLSDMKAMGWERTSI